MDVDPEPPKKLIMQVNGMFTAMRLALDQTTPPLVVPALILLYSLIDALAFLYMPADQQDVTGADFEAWVDQFVAPHVALGCSGSDLYAARCGLLHSHIMDSRLARQGRAVHIWYVLEDGRILAPLRQASGALPVALHVKPLVNAIADAANRFCDEVTRDDELRQRVADRVDLYFDMLTPISPPPQRR